MNSKQWSIRQMLLWVFIAALILSHVSRFYQNQIVGFTHCLVDNNQIFEWISDIDPKAQRSGGGVSSGSSGDSCDSDIDYSFVTESATSEGLLVHVRDSYRDKATQEGWEIQLSGGGGDSFQFAMSKGISRFRIWCWVLPVEDSSYADRLKRDGKFVTRLKILQVGYRIR